LLIPETFFYFNSALVKKELGDIMAVATNTNKVFFSGLSISSPKEIIMLVIRILPKKI